MFIKQSARTVADYTIEFCTLAAESGWNNEALVAFSHGLSDNIKDEITARDKLKNFEELISFAILINTRLQESLSFKKHLW